MSENKINETEHVYCNNNEKLRKFLYILDLTEKVKSISDDFRNKEFDTVEVFAVFFKKQFNKIEKELQLADFINTIHILLDKAIKTVCTKNNKKRFKNKSVEQIKVILENEQIDLKRIEDFKADMVEQVDKYIKLYNKLND